MYLLVAYGDQADEFAGPVEIILEIDRAVGVDLWAAGEGP